MTPELLRISILQSALKGELTEHFYDTENARTDYPTIQESDTDAIPYDLPKNWLWVSLGDVATNQNGYAFKPTDWLSSGTKIIRIQNLTDTNVPCNYCDERAIDDKFKISNGDVLVSWSCTIDAFLYEGEDAVLNQHIFKIVFNKIQIDKYFYIYAIKSLLSSINSKRHGSTMTHITKKDFESLYFPLPPLEEQHRIVAKLDALFPLVECYSNSYYKLEVINSRFPDELKKSILQQAVMGNLVPQDPNEEPASLLLDKIRVERAALIKAGKLKKDKHESIIYCRDNSYYEKIDGKEICLDDEIPFEIPGSWEWCRIYQVFTTSSGTTPSKSNPKFYSMPKYNWVRTTDLNNGILNTCEVQISQEAFDECNLEILPRYSVCIAMYGGSGTIGKNALIDFDTTINQSVCAIHYNPHMNMKYVLAYIKYLRPQWMNFASGSRKDPNINQVIIKNMLIPIPPLAEQKRIIEKLENILNFCNSLAG